MLTKSDRHWSISWFSEHRGIEVFNLFKLSVDAALLSELRKSVLKSLFHLNLPGALS